MQDEVVGEFDQLYEDLARQEAALRERRQRLRDLLDAAELPAEGPVSPELAALFSAMAPLSDSPMAAKDREVLALIETAANPAERERLLGAVSSALGSPEAVGAANEAYALLDDLADAAPDDPRVAEAARTLAALIPPGLLPSTDIDEDHSFLRAFYADFAPAQAEAIRRTLRILMEDRP